MPRFFIADLQVQAGDVISITGADARHIALSLRMRIGDEVTVCNTEGTEYHCILQQLQPECVLAQVQFVIESSAEPTVRVHIYQGLPKAEKMELLIQKCVELGADAFTPVFMTNCVSRPDEKSLQKKVERWQKIAQEAAKQSGRGRIPTVHSGKTFADAIEEAPGKKLLLYEKGGAALRDVLADRPAEISMFIGPEGGITPQEAQLALKNGVIPIGLGKRILRTETAPIACTAAIMALTGNLE